MNIEFFGSDRPSTLLPTYKMSHTEQSESVMYLEFEWLAYLLLSFLLTMLLQFLVFQAHALLTVCLCMLQLPEVTNSKSYILLLVDQTKWAKGGSDIFKSQGPLPSFSYCPCPCCDESPCSCSRYCCHLPRCQFCPRCASASVQ
jgi:hypothetical protein